MHVNLARQGRRRRPIIGAVLAAAVVVGAGIGVYALTQGDEDRPNARPTQSASTLAKSKVISHFSGSGSTTTVLFSTDTNWQVRWTAAKGSGFRVELVNDRSVSRGIIVTGVTTTSGSVYVTEKGTYKLRVTSSKPWTIDIVSRPPQS